MNQDLADCLRTMDPRFINDMAIHTKEAQSFTEVIRLSTLRRRAMRAGLWPKPEEGEDLRVAGTLYPFTELLEHHLEASGTRCRLFVGDYDNYTAEILEESSPLRAFRPEVTILIPSARRCVSSGLLADPPQVHRACAQAQVENLLGLCGVLHAVTGSEVILANFLLPSRMDPGSYRTRTLGSPWSFRKQVNLELGLQAPAFVQICDVEQMGCRFGNLNAADDRTWFESKQAFTPDMTERVAREAAHQIRSLRQSTKKVLVMDLDNTLWGGVIGDDGLAGIELGDTSPRGEAFKAFQAYAKALTQRGILLAVCSKNDEAVAKEPFGHHPEMVLRLDDIVAFRANWNPKSENLVEIAAQLNLGLDSLVFVDDNPSEIDIVRQFVPEVEAILLGPDPSAFVAILEDSRLFEPRSLTREDSERVAQYRLANLGQQLLAKATDMDSYLSSLEMQACIQPFTPLDVPRIAQLINKSNQFNLTTRRRTEGEVAALVDDPARPAFSVRLADRFGDHGLIAVVITEHRGETLEVDTWLMSCRVLKRQVEDLVLNEIVRLARKRDCQRIIGRYVPSPKNQMVSTLFPDLGFAPASSSPEGCAKYVLEAGRFSDRKTAIKLEPPRRLHGSE